MTVGQFVYYTTRPFWGYIAFLMLVGALWAADHVFSSYIVKLILDNLHMGNKDTITDTIIFYSLLMVSWRAFVIVSYRGYDYCLVKMGPALKQNITLSLTEHVLGHDHTFFQNNFAGSLMNKINDVTTGVREMIVLFVDNLLSRMLMLIFILAALCTTNIRFGIISGIWVLSLVIIGIWCGKRGQDLSDTASGKNTILTGKTVDIFSNIMSVRLFSRKKEELKNAKSWTEARTQAERDVEWYFLKIWAFQGFSFLIVESISLYLLITGWQVGTVTVGDFALILYLNGSIIDNMWTFSKDFSNFIEHLGKTRQGLHILTESHKMIDSPDAKHLRVINGKIEFQNVTFHYSSPLPLFDKLNITIAPGEKVGLVGYSGSGKSTFANLILRLFDIDHGKILIDEQDIKHVTQESLRNHIALIPQDPSLFHRTILQNIWYARPEASYEEVVHAAKLAHAHDFIESLKDGYNSTVGEKGSKISGGQRQRIAIARAILKKSPILLLDEATSALDSMTEALIQESLLLLMTNCTTIVIAHRLSTLLSMDRILVFESGKIVQDGPHETLFKEDGLYKKLWSAQVGGFLPNKGI